MSANNKIEMLCLQDRVLSLRSMGGSTYSIAETLTKDLAGKDTVSQSAVQRWLQKETKKRKAVADAVIEDYITTSLPADLNILDELSETYLLIFRHNTGALSKVLSFLQSNITSLDEYRELKKELEDHLPSSTVKNNVSIPIDLAMPSLKTGMAAGDRLHEILKTKFRFVGVGDPDEKGTAQISDRERKELQEIAKIRAEREREILDATNP